jgi:capsular polysaccharide biosynthesis protein|tara:strand:+ start:572 stop:1684 length:1113 start_codon:yes stop_codon:yes gene_type:complete
MIKFKKKIQFYFKRFFQIAFMLIYGEIKYKSNVIASKNIVKKKIENIISDINNSESYFSYKINNGRVYTDYVEHVAIIDGNNLVNKASHQQISGELKDAKENIVLTKGTPRIKKKIKGRVLTLVQGASGNKNYFHWVFDILPKIKLCSEHYLLNEIDFFYLPKLQNFQKQTLSIFGIGEEKILSSNLYRHIQASELIVVDHPWYHKGFILDQVEFLPSWIIHWLRDVYLKCAKKFDGNEKIYIDRTESKFNHCQIQNDNEIFDFLKEKGYSKYKVGDLSFFEQIYLFQNAKNIIGAHGAAFTNLVFCEPNTKIIEIRPSTQPNNNYKRISQVANLDYRLIETKKLNENQKKLGDIYLPIKELDHCIKSFG